MRITFRQFICHFFYYCEIEDKTTDSNSVQFQKPKSVSRKSSHFANIGLAGTGLAVIIRYVRQAGIRHQIRSEEMVGHERRVELRTDGDGVGN